MNRIQSQLHHYKLSYTVLNNIEVYEDPVPRTKKITHLAVKIEASEVNRIVYHSILTSRENIGGYIDTAVNGISRHIEMKYMIFKKEIKIFHPVTILITLLSN